MITVYGDIILDKDERSFLSLGPDFPLMDSFNTKEAARDFVTALMEIRLGRMGRDSSEIVRYRVQSEIQEDEEGEK